MEEIIIVRKKTSRKKQTNPASKIILAVIGLLFIIGVSVVLYILWQTPINYNQYIEMVEANDIYLLENQATMVASIQENGDDPQDLGHIFLPERPSEYIDIAHVPQHNVVLQNQNDPQWANLSYGTDSSRKLWENGCAIVVLSMIDSYFSRQETSPKDILNWSGNDYYMDHQGTSWQIYSAFGEAFGYNVIDMGNNFSQAVDYLNNGYLIVVSVGPGTFTHGGHVMLLRGYQNGQVFLNDPNDAPHKMFSIQGIPAEVLMNDSLNYWAIGNY